MSAKSKKFDFRTMLYIIIIALILIAAVYVILGGDGESTTVYSPVEVLTNKNIFVNKNIVVEGNYYVSPDGPAVTNPTTDPNPVNTQWLNLDFQEGINVTTAVTEGNKYRFTGLLKWDPNALIPNTDVVLEVSEIEEI